MCRVVNEHCNCKGSADPSWKNIWLWAALTLLRSHYCTLFSPWLYWAYEVINYGFSHKKSCMGLSEWPETDLLAKSSNLWLTHSSPFRDIIRPSGLVLIPHGNTEERLKLSALRCWISCGWPLAFSNTVSVHRNTSHVNTQWTKGFCPSWTSVSNVSRLQFWPLSVQLSLRTNWSKCKHKFQDSLCLFATGQRAHADYRCSCAALLLFSLSKSKLQQRATLTMLKPCHEWFSLPWAEMHVNTFYDLAVCQDMVIQICSSDGLDWCLPWWSSWRKVSKLFGRVARSVSRLARPSRLLLLGPASLPLSLTQAQTQSEDRDTIQWDLWVQFVCFNGQEAPKLTTDRPLWDVHSWDINVKSHQGFIKFWPRSGFPWPCEGLWFVGKHYEDNLQLGTLSIPYCFLLCELDSQRA